MRERERGKGIYMKEQKDKEEGDFGAEMSKIREAHAEEQCCLY